MCKDKLTQYLVACGVFLIIATTAVFVINDKDLFNIILFKRSSIFQKGLEGNKPIIKEIESDYFAKLLENSSVYRFLVVYASWCGHCRQDIPHVMKAVSKYKNKNINVIFLSLDKTHDSLKSFLSAYNNYNSVHYIASPSLRLDIVRQMRRNNIKYRGSVPFFALIDNKNNIYYDPYKIYVIMKNLE